MESIKLPAHGLDCDVFGNGRNSRGARSKWGTIRILDANRRAIIFLQNRVSDSSPRLRARNQYMVEVCKAAGFSMIIHLIDGTYELFRHFYGLRRFNNGEDRPFGAVIGVLQTVLQMIETGATHVGVATDHVIESFRNRMWPDYKTGDGIEPALLAQFHPLEQALAAMGVVVWPMIELEADDALASAARIASENEGAQKVCIWTPDKDLAQCVRGDRVVQVDRRAKKIRNAEGVREKFGVAPGLIPDFLALVGDAADGYPGIAGIGPIAAARLLNQHGNIESFPPGVLRDSRDLALLFKDLATLRTDAGLFHDVDELRWRGPTEAFAACADNLGQARLLERCRKLPIG